MANQKGGLDEHSLFYEDPKKSDHTKYILGLTRRRRTKHSDRVTTTKRGFGWFGFRAKRTSVNDMGKD